MPVHLPAVTRRGFLAASAAAVAGLACPLASHGEEPRSDPNRFLLLSDTHVWEHTGKEHSGQNPYRNFLQARAEYLALAPRPAQAIICGDCVFIEGHKADYAVLAEVVDPIRQAGIPLTFAMGNHDNRENLYEVFTALRPESPPVPDKHVTVIDSPHARWFVLDSLQRTNFTPGTMGEAQLAWLGESLDRHNDKPALVMAHHNPEPGLTTGTGLRDTDALLDVLAARPHVKAYFYGHTHCWGQRMLRGIHLVNLPTHVWVFDPTQPRGWVDAQLRPGGIRLQLHALDHGHKAHQQVFDLEWKTA